MSQFTLADPEAPLVYLRDLTALPDGGFVSVDFVARKVRRFREDGTTVGAVGPPQLEEGDEWSPMAGGLASDGETLFVSDRRGRMWKLNMANGSASLDSPNAKIHGFSIGPKDNIVAWEPHDGFELQLYDSGRLGKQFLTTDENNLSVGSRASSQLTFDSGGNIYAVRGFEGTVFVFDASGTLLRSWRLPRDRNFREFPLGFDPFRSTHDRNALLSWRRTFTTFSGIQALPNGQLAVLMANSPPERPNTLVLYTREGALLGTVETNQYLIGADNGSLLFTDSYLFFDGSCTVYRYTLAE